MTDFIGNPRGGAGLALDPHQETDVALAERPAADPASGHRAGRFRVAATDAALFFGLLLIYLGTANGRMIFGDDRLMYEVTSGIVEHGDVAVQATEETGHIARGQDGRYYSKFGPGLSIVALPIYSAGKVI